VVLTGAGGFIGSHLAARLVEEGASVRAFIHYNSRGDTGHIRALPKHVREELDIVAGDVRDDRTVAEVVRGTDTVFHLAALIGVPYSFVSPVDVVQTNVLGTLNVLNAAREAQVRRVVHTSTSEVYGTARYVPIDEAHPLQAQSPYAASKIAADKLAESFARSFELPVVTVRPFNAYGPRQSARAVIPAIVIQALREDVVRMGSRESRRDFTFVEDTCEGFLRVGAADGAVGEVVNVGSGSDVSMGDVADKVVSIIGRPISVVQDAARLRPGDSEVMRLLCDNRKARKLASWRPIVTLEEGLRRTIEWIEAHTDQYGSRAYAI
jgi:dTDP-glucose 4,6-dehydratase